MTLTHGEKCVEFYFPPSRPFYTPLTDWGCNAQNRSLLVRERVTSSFSKRHLKTALKKHTQKWLKKKRKKREANSPKKGSAYATQKKD